MGSVKDLQVIKNPEGNKLGLGRFTFSDRYSVFDWGEMPDHIEGKGAALCMTSAYFFEKLESEGIGTHFAGVVENGKAARLADVKTPRHSMEIKLVRIVRPELHGNSYEYSIFKKERTNLLVPLEVIYRNSLPEGSSVFKRLKNGTLKLEDIGMKAMPKAGTILDKPLFDVSTKLESTDRYMSWQEAASISGLDAGELEALKKTVFAINSLITKEAKKAGLVNEDGKVEFGFDENRRLILLDTVGTLDECRFTFGGLPVSKEILRMHYRGTPWHNEVEEAKKSGDVTWKKMVKSQPPKLPPALAKLISELYKSCCNEITGRVWFGGVPSVEKVLREITK